MVKPKANDATIILFDVGRNTKEFDESKSQTFYEQAKKCVEAIVTRKIFTKPTDDVGLFLIGSKATANTLSEVHGGYENISQALVLDPIKWDTLKFIQNDIEPPNEDITADWMDALVVAMDYFRSLELPFSSKKLLLFTTFSTDVDSENVDAVIEGIKQLDIELFVVTKNVIGEMDANDQSDSASFSQDAGKDKIRQKNEELIIDIVKQTNGTLCSLDEAVSKLIYVDKMQRKRMPWQCDLTIGSNVAIKISAYIYVREEKELAGWKSRTPTGDTCETKTEYYHNDDLIDREVVATELIKGYLYGGVTVDYSDDSSKDNGGKGLLCIGFTKVSTILPEHFEGTSIWMVVPQKGFEVSAKRFSALIRAMKKANLAIIARYTYRAGTAPKLMALFPHDDSLLMHELYFKDNIVSVSFPSLITKKYTPTDDQYEFMDKFIDAMDLNDPKNPSSERLKNLMDPGLQHSYRVLAHRALNPKDPLPKIDDDLLALITTPKVAEIDIDQMKTLFPTEPIKLTTREKFLRNIRNIDNDVVDEVGMIENLKAQNDSQITEIGTIRPAEDFLELLHRGEKFDKLGDQVQNVIVNLVTKAMISMDDKIHMALLAYRETAKQKMPYKYNEWIKTLKELLQEREKISVWELIVNESLGLITENETEISTVSVEEAAAFYKSDDFGKELNRVTDMDTGAGNDLFDDM